MKNQYVSKCYEWRQRNLFFGPAQKTVEKNMFTDYICAVLGNHPPFNPVVRGQRAAPFYEMLYNTLKQLQEE